MNRLFFLFLYLPAICFSQVQFKLSHGGNGYDYARMVIPTIQKGYVFTGSTTSTGTGTADLSVVVIDSTGIILFERTHGGNGVERGNRIIQNADSSMMIVGYSTSSGAGGYDIYLVKTDQFGNEVWSAFYGGTDWDFGQDICETADGNYVLLGSTYSFGAGNSDFYLVKIDPLGDTIWTRTYGSTEDELPGSVKLTSDGGFILAGTTFKNDTSGDAYIIKTNADGDTLWTRTYEFPGTGTAGAAIQLSDGNFAAAGTKAYSGNQEMHIWKFDQNTVFWDTTYGGPEKDEALDLAETSTNLLVIGGNSYSYGFANGSCDFYFLKLNGSGGFLNSTTHGEPSAPDDDFCWSIRESWDKGYILAGSTEGLNSNGIPNALIVKTDTNGFTTATYTISVNETGFKTNMIWVYPNPFSGEANFQVENDNQNLKIEILDLNGRKSGRLITERISADKYRIVNQGTAAGLYLIKIISAERTFYGRICVSD